MSAWARTVRGVIEVDGHRIEPLTAATWPAFAAMNERQKSLFTGCWCTNFHCYPDPPERKVIGKVLLAP